MTAQIGDKFMIRDRSYTMAAASNPIPFTPKEYGIIADACCTDCWRGFWCIYDFFDIDSDALENGGEEIDVLQFVKEHVDPEITQDDIEDYYSMLDLYDIDKSSRLLNWQNEPSLVALIAWSFKNDVTLDDWIREYFKSNTMYFVNQVKNYIHMKKDLESYLRLQEKQAV